MTTDLCPSTVLDGMHVLAETYLCLAPGERVLVLTSDELADQDSQELLETLAQEFRRRGAVVTTRPAGVSLDVSLLDQHDVAVLVSRLKSVHRTPVLDHLASHPGGVRVYRLLNFTRDLLELALRVPKQELRTLNDEVIRAGRQTKQVRVTSDAGTDLVIAPLPDGGWTNSCGHFDGRFPGVLPPGEVNTYTPHVSGTVVADGALNTSFDFPGDPRLAEHPVRLSVEQGRVTDISCAGPVTNQVLEAFMSVPNADRIGEVGFGTNLGIDRWVDFVSHINERHPGLHLGLGTPAQSRDKVDWSCPLHVDMILADCVIAFDDVEVFRAGSWNRPTLQRTAGGGFAWDVLHVDAV